MRRLYETEYVPTTSPSSNTSSANTNINPTTRSLLDLDFDDDEKYDELEYYILEKPANKDVDVLAWWKAHQTQFPRLACMARDYLPISATSVASERAFSAGERMITNNRFRLAPKTAREAQYLRSWMQGPLKGKLVDL